MFQDRNLICWIPIAVFLLAPCMVWAGGPEQLGYGEVYSAKVPEALQKNGFNEAYFWTHGPVTVFTYDYPGVIAIRDPDHPDTPVATGSTTESQQYADFDLDPGFYFISVTQEAGVLVGVSSTDKCNGYFQYRSTGEAYADNPLATKWFFRATDGCSNLAYVFSPAGAASGFWCGNTVCFGKLGETYYSIDDSNDYYPFSPGDIHGVLEVTSGGPVTLLSRDHPGYFVPPYTQETWSNSYFQTYHAPDEYLNVHSFADGTEVVVTSMQTDPPQTIWTGTLNEGQTESLHYTGFIIGRSVVKVRATKGQASVSVLGGGTSADNNYMTQVLDAAGNMQGTDFITRSHTGGFINVIGLDDGTTVEVRDASTEELQSVHHVDEAQFVNVNPGAGIWRIRSDQDVTACVGKGNGGTYIPLTANTSGSTPFPPVIVGVNWRPLHPRTSNNRITVTWLTDELATTRLHYKIGSGSWQQHTEPGYRTEHEVDVNISLAEETDVQFYVEATDQSGMTTVNDNDGANYHVTVRKDAPSIEVELSSVIEHAATQTLHFRISNVGDGDANDLEVSFYLYGMQPFTDGVDSS